MSFLAENPWIGDNLEFLSNNDLVARVRVYSRLSDDYLLGQWEPLIQPVRGP